MDLVAKENENADLRQKLKKAKDGKRTPDWDLKIQRESEAKKTGPTTTGGKTRQTCFLPSKSVG